MNMSCPMANTSPTLLGDENFNNRFFRSKYTTYAKNPESLLELLNLIAADSTELYVQEALRWLVNNKLIAILKVILKHDHTLMNKIFDPTNIQMHDSLTISKSAFENIHNLLIQNEKGSAKYDVFAVAVLFETTKEDFDYIVKSYFDDSKHSRKPFKKVFSLFQMFFKPGHIEKLLSMMRNCYRKEFFGLVWLHVGESHIGAVADFIWEKFDILKKCRETVDINNKFQLEIALNICERCMLPAELAAETKTTAATTILDFSRCFLFYSLVNNSSEADPHLKAGLSKIIAFQQQELLKGICNLSGTVHDTLLDEIRHIFQRSEESYRLELLQEVFKNEIFIDASIASKVIEWNPSFDCGLLPEHILLLRLLRKKLGDSFWMNMYSSVFINPEPHSFSYLNSSDRKFLIEFLLEAGDPEYSAEYFIWMAENYLLELRPFEDKIKQLYLKFPHCDDLFQIVRKALTTKSQKEFDKIYCERIESGKLSVAEFAAPNDDPAFLLRVRIGMRMNFHGKLSASNSRYFGILVAFYGEPFDLDRGLPLPYSQIFLCSFLQNLKYYKFEITQVQSNRICLKFQQIMDIFPLPSPSYHTPEKLDSLMAYVLRHHQDEEFLPVMSRMLIAKSPKTLFIESSLQLIILENRAITQDDIVDIVKDDNFDLVRYRFKEIWDLLTEEAKEFLADTRKEFSLLYYHPSQPEFFMFACSLYKREHALVAFERYQNMAAICVGKVMMLGHWFFVDEFDMEIGTSGCLGFFELAADAMKKSNVSD
jgi:hypothetical protein